MTWTLAAANAAPPEEFIETLGGIFEKSPWVAAAAAAARPYADVEALHAAMAAAVRESALAVQLELIRAHPDLAGKAARIGNVTEESRSEQAGAGLDQLTEEEFERFDRLNTAYQARFGFPFIIAVRGHDKHGILAAFEDRLGNEADVEIATALEQIFTIARLRLDDLFATGA